MNKAYYNRYIEKIIFCTSLKKFKKVDKHSTFSDNDKTFYLLKFFMKQFKYTPRTVPRLFGGWDVSNDEYKNLGMTIGLPPNFYVENEHPDIDLLSKQIEDYTTDELSGYGTPMQDLLNARWSRQILIHNIPKNIDKDKLKDFLIKLIKDFPDYTEGSISDVHIMNLKDKSKRIALITFANDDIALALHHRYDRFKLEGTTVNITTFHQYVEPLPTYGEFTRSSLRNVIARISRKDFDDILSLYPNIIETKDLQNGCYIFYFNTKEEAEQMVRELDDKYDIAIHRLPGPKLNTDSLITSLTGAKRKKYENLPENVMSVLISPDCKIKDFYQEEITTFIDIDLLPSYPYRFVRFYNVFNKLTLQEKFFDQILEDFKKGLSEYGHVVRLQLPNPPDFVANYTYITAEFETPGQAFSVQKNISGRYFLGRPIITQLVEKF